LEDGAVTAAKIGGVLFPSQVPDLDASKITSGTLPNERLSSDVARRAGGNTFTGTQTITNGNVGIGTPSPAATLDVNGSIRVGGGGTVIQRIQSGQAQMASGSATGRTNLTITFPTAFATPPKILASVANDPGWDVDDTFAVSTRRVTTTNCVVNIMRVDLNGGWSQLVRVNWQAWE
jgi:hypothetical protein